MAKSQLNARKKTRLEKELAIDGTGLDLNHTPPPRKQKTILHNGARYEAEDTDDDDNITVAPPAVGKKRRRDPSERREEIRKKSRVSLSKAGDVDTNADVPPQAKTVIRKPAAITARKPKSKPKAAATNLTRQHRDEVFRESCLSQFEQLRDSRDDDVKLIVPFLEVMEQLRKDRTQRDLDDTSFGDDAAPDAYILTSPDAKRILASNASIRAPIFVLDGTRALFENESRRPIQVVLEDWFIDEKEINLVLPTDKDVEISELREHFLSANGAVESPWNLSEIPNPLADHAIPEFASSLNCHFLSEMVRRLLDVAEENICQDACKKRTVKKACCEEHRLTVDEHVALQDAWKQWHGGLMMADAGATTRGHWDQWSTGIWIACYEGEIGLCWQSYPTDEQRTQWHRDATEPNGTYLYKVLRPGDVVYMPPGTVHHVFRLPEGKQTLAMCGQVLRRNALDEWLEIVLLELQHAESEWAKAKNPKVTLVTYEVYMLPAVRITERLVQQAKSEREIERFGGKEMIEKVLSLLKELEALGLQLQELASTMKWK